ncbi:hypothetical protein DRB17_09410 [Ferruginivarius sediminum]|uniref:DUF411 domain-containing protein n=2 Tax=Ferruginivarius sediminum TaxID=2661937 RepID=A0A369TD06_9PROT|nr:hypothetical protein DRB17_09410 [Ferruginivarius sediminum]
MFSRRRLLAGGVLAIGGLAVSGVFAGPAGAGNGTISVYKNPSCGCCGNWVDYLRRNGWSVEVTDLDNVSSIKRQAGVPDELAACHTAIVDGYVVEGHVPVSAIEQLLRERPKLSGIAVPGMPADSPGMGGGGVQDVIGFRHGAAKGLYTRARD